MQAIFPFPPNECMCVHLPERARMPLPVFVCAPSAEKSAMKLITIMDVGVHVYVPFCMVCVCVRV